MFLFIAVLKALLFLISYSNTSHVLIYPTYFRHSSFPLYKYFLYFTRFSPYFPKCFALYFLLTPQSPNVLYLQQSSAFHLYWRLVLYKNKLSPFSLSFFPRTSSPNTLSFINLIIHIKSSSL